MTVQIRASDLDSKKSGWAGQIDGRTERVKVVLDPGIDEFEVFGKQNTRADVTIISKLKSGGNELLPDASNFRLLAKGRSSCVKVRETPVRRFAEQGRGHIKPRPSNFSSLMPTATTQHPP